MSTLPPTHREDSHKLPVLKVQLPTSCGTDSPECERCVMRFIERRSESELGKAIVKEGFIESYSHPLEILFAVLAIGAAYKVGAYE